MKTIAFRHELHPSNVALLARLGWRAEIDPTAPPCVTFAGGRDAEIRTDGCRRCRRIERDATSRPLPS